MTAVEWLMNELANTGLLVTKDIDNLVAYSKAKQMEKEQIEAAWWSGHDERNESPVIHPSEDCNGYYNETYKK